MKKLNISAAIIALGIFLTGCGSTSDKASGGKVEAENEVKKIIVGTGTQFPNICFLDDKGRLTGYDVELVREIDKRLPDYEFEFKTMEFSNLLLSLETKKIDLIAHQMEVNEERKEKFLFNNEPYNVFPLNVVVHQDNQDIKSVKDLAGKKVIVGATSNSAVLIEKYNKENGGKINIVYSGQGSDDTKTQLKTGRADATISTPFAVDFLNDAADAQQKVVGPALSNSKVFFLLQKGDTEIRDKVDGALKEIKKDGTLTELSTKWLGADYTVAN
ncbi:amino acid ABC transporter substrate-binding protein [Bacillus sp. CMF21]|uniref:amino acid ABC transporter substrate-binding protein n=1 Tax=Metabacillus dongyingensis TaxID=2874282 RepID=UPI001CBF417D|nr:amino acid ABC transporter substrate-binding protein [Metabacillus dongyingensis]UAL50605.1 amino acid ABC transporter substrate-binding protein [Metabacillus dongyingensis]USK26871.1 amino acid ABC transporter substrate-binding protein [Bacillus sp. CMF21]